MLRRDRTSRINHAVNVVGASHFPRLPIGVLRRSIQDIMLAATQDRSIHQAVRSAQTLTELHGIGTRQLHMNDAEFVYLVLISATAGVADEDLAFLNDL